jgi:predicted nucleotidyltransferase
MLKNQTVNLKVIEKVALALGDINDEVIYIGGAVVGLYVTDKGADLPRPTKDIDISVQVSTYSEMEQLRIKLAAKGIHPAVNETVMYRYSYDDILIDFIPYEDTPLGPTNRWLKPGFNKAYSVPVGKAVIKMLPVSLFLATKWEAFKDRGDDPRVAPDFEDIIYVLDNNVDIVKDVKKSAPDVRSFLKEMSEEILSNPFFDEIVECHLNPFTAEKRKQMIAEKLKQIKDLD